MIDNYIKRTIRINNSLNDKIKAITRESVSKFSNKTIIDLLELGILKYEESKIENIKNDILLHKIDLLIDLLGRKNE